MKMLIRIAFFAFIIIIACEGKEDRVNIIGYYAVQNSLDGQPMIDMQNMLRFFPVFAMRDNIDTVRVTVYYGPKIYTRQADRMDDGRYWQVLLPKFNLGQAIQRLEVEATFQISDELTKSVLESMDNQKKEVDGNIKKIKTDFSNNFKENNESFKKIGISLSQANQIKKNYEKDIVHFTQSLGDSFNQVKKETILKLAKTRSDLLKQYLKSYNDYDSTYSYLLSKRNSLIKEFAKDLEINLTDTTYSGVSVRKSDLVISPDYTNAKILYRNYNTALRRMPALDPAEKMGIFRARYVPFPIVGIGNNDKMKLLKPFASGSPTVFEIGLAFGDAIVPGDAFVVPGFAWQRLGIAFAITEKLFSDSAQVLGLALTYDFNSYGSIGIGANFAGQQIRNYMSLGINKKAFEAVLGLVVKLFSKQ